MLLGKEDAEEAEEAEGAEEAEEEEEGNDDDDDDDDDESGGVGEEATEEAVALMGGRSGSGGPLLFLWCFDDGEATVVVPVVVVVELFIFADDKVGVRCIAGATHSSRLQSRTAKISPSSKCTSYLSFSATYFPRVPTLPFNLSVLRFTNRTRIAPSFFVSV